MDTEQLRDFLTVARYRNFSKAAEALYIGQPALSRRISALEKQLGVQLFHRDHKAVELTQAGELLRGEAQDLIEQLDQLEEKMHAAAQGAQSQIRVSTMGFLSARISQAIQRTIEAMPGDIIELEVLVPDEQESIFQPKAADVAFMIGDFSAAKAARSEQKHILPLEGAPFAFLLPADHPLTRLEQIRPQDLLGERLIFLKVERPPTQVQGLLRAVPGQAQAVFKKNIASVALEVEMHRGIGFMPAFEAEERCRLSDVLTSRPAADLPVEAGVFLSWRDTRDNPAVKRFIQTFLQFYHA